MHEPDTEPSDLRHATTVSVAGRGLMIEGPSGAGKSALALELMAMGARLVADDATLVWRGRHGVALWAGAPSSLPRRIEARGLGLAGARVFGPVPLLAVISLERTATERLPHPCHASILGREVALFERPRGGPVAAALFQFIGAIAPDPTMTEFA